VTEPLALAFVWHMHQPYYRSSRTGEFLMPWVRLHALKDYADMVEILQDFPGVRQTFNLVPSLIEQLEEYGAGRFRETYWDHTLKPAEDMDESERSFVVDLMCERSWHPRAQAHPRYRELSSKKESCLQLGIDRCAKTFSTAEIRDLQVWFNLAWFDPVYLEREPLAGLVAKGRDFSEEDKLALRQVQEEILRRTLPVYAEAQAAGRIEITTSPYFHPILPLLVNTDLARVSRADVVLPPRRFAHPEDAVEQIERGLRKHEETFGRPTRGMWCSEMGIGEDVIPLLAERGVEWTIGDEEHLARSLGTRFDRSEAGHLEQPALLYRPYRLEREGAELAVIFRDHALSDLIGFTYQSWGPRDAAANLVWRLREARRELADSTEPHLVTIALDGENAWEYYSRDGRDFLRYLYEGLEDDPGFACVTVSEHLDRHPATRELPWLHTGSWIFGDFSTWIGDEAHSRAWDLLHTARDVVAAKVAAAGGPDEAPPLVREAWHHILVAEGSDWFWWFGEHQASDIDDLWDLDFRRQLQEAYRLLGLTPPLALFAPILSGRPGGEQRAPASSLTPRIDGLVSPPEEWEEAGVCRAAVGGTMQRAQERTLAELRYGADEHNLFLLLIPGGPGFLPGTELAVYLGRPAAAARDKAEGQAGHHTRFWGQSRAAGELGFEASVELLVRVETGPQITASLARPSPEGAWDHVRDIREAAYDEVFEVALPLRDLEIGEDASLALVVGLGREGVLLELLPERGVIVLDLTRRGETGHRL
jgi:alpha-amylase/alpha-mannosidase (GH57 family)